MAHFATRIFVFSLLLLLVACQGDQPETPVAAKANTADQKIQFDKLLPTQTGVTFSNQLDMDKLKISLDYINVYNGGGVAVGDINNDGLDDLYFTGNLVDNKLYLNKGNLQFEDITAKAGVACSASWSTGVTMADVNNDGWLDIYVCRSYHDEPSTLRENQLFINNGDLTFSEESAKYGVNDPNYSIQACFFDYDQDGHLDLFVGNHPRLRRQNQDVHYRFFRNPVEEFSDRLYKNNGNGTFTDVTKKAGILNYGWSLGISPSDFNDDGLTDIFIAVDHFEPDKLYQNNGDGTFTNVIESKFKHITTSSMGSDAADINNDGLVDLFVVDMLAQDNFLQKTQMGSMNPQRFWDFTRNGYHYQYMRNQLHLNTGQNTFVDVGQLAGLHNTDWSWATLAADLNNDGWKDYYVANGYYRNILDKDKLKDLRKEMYKAEKQNKSLVPAALAFTKKLTTTKSKNYCYQNNQDLTFKDVSASSGLDHLGYSNGATYADLNQDGKLDLIVNNIDEAASIFINQSEGQHYLRFQFESAEKGMHAIGAKVKLYTGEALQYQEFQPTRGYQSSVEHALHFGLGAATLADRVEITWPNGKTQLLTNVKADQTILLKYSEAQSGGQTAVAQKAGLFKEATQDYQLDFVHQENEYDDYKKQILLPHKMSQFGPFITTGDVNGDQLADFYVGGAAGQAGGLYIQKAGGEFDQIKVPAFEKDKAYEDMEAALFDADQDGDLDLYVVSGGNAHPLNDPLYRDRFYRNDGQGDFTAEQGAIPAFTVSGSCVKPCDYDQDGDLDLFVGGRHFPGAYPSPVSSYIFENVNGSFGDATRNKAPDLKDIGMVTDAQWADLNKDGQLDLMLVGEWMPVTVFLSDEKGRLTNRTEELGLANDIGWWYEIEANDFDGDGDLDFALGNLGLNYKYIASKEKPFHIYAADFDNNNSYDIALGYINNGNDIFPVRGRQCSSEQCPVIAKKFPSYAEFASATIEEVYGDDLQYARHYEATNFASSILLNQGDDQFELRSLPNEAQLAPVNGIVSMDVDQDGHLDLLIGGNLYVSEVETGRADAGTGLYLKGDGKGNFTTVTSTQSGFFIPGDVKDLEVIDLKGSKQPGVLVTNNDGPLQLWQMQ